MRNIALVRRIAAAVAGALRRACGGHDRQDAGPSHRSVSSMSARGGAGAAADPYKRLAPSVGKACARLLLAERFWVHRRTETIDVLSHEHIRRSVAVDMTVPEPFRPLLTLPSGFGCLLPVATLRKGPLRNFDLRDEGGHALPAVSKAHNGAIATEILIYRASRALKDAGIESPSERLQTDLRRIATKPPSDADAGLNCLVEAARAGDQQAKIVIQDPKTGFFLLDLAQNYILIAVVESLAPRRIIKFAYDTATNVGSAPLVGLAQHYLDIEVPGATRAASYHAEVVVPEELRIAGAFLYDEEGGTINVHAVDENVDRAALYAADIPLERKPPSIFLAVRSERTGFADFDADTAGPPIAILLAASALFSGAVARSGEHTLVQALFARPRQLLVLLAVCALAAAGVLAFGASESAIRWAWRSGAAVATLIAGLLTLAYVRSAPLRRGPKEGRRTRALRSN
jgi:hypothetical protein